MMVDLDGDGVSAVAWGTDCDDFDSFRHPSLPEWDDGQDHNCNGKVRPKTSTPSMRGLTPAVGNPDAEPQEFDRAVLVTIDCFREDALTPEVTPNLAKLAARGIRFQKLYSGGARTALSLPLLLRGGYKMPSVTRMLGQAKVSTVSLFGYRHSTLEGNVFDDFQVATRPPIVDHRIRAPELTDLALADLRDPKNATQHFLWVHYFDAHGPRALRVLPTDLPEFPMPAHELDPEMTLYLKQLYFVDRHLGRLIEGIDALPGRTLLIVTNDHGEGFGQHGVYEHGISSFEQIIHAPGILVAPGIAPGVYPHVLAQRDIAATIAGAFGLVATHPEIETFGRSWLRLRGAPGAPLHEFAVSYETTSPFEHWSDAPMASIVDDDGKFSVSYVDGIRRYFRMNDDPGELHDLTARRPADVARYLDRLETFRDIDTTPR
jgi:arylsulfatase A-like enzyme